MGASAYGRGLAQDARASKEKVTCSFFHNKTSLFPIAYNKSIVNRIVFEEYQMRARGSQVDEKNIDINADAGRLATLAVRRNVHLSQANPELATETTSDSASPHI